MTGFRFPFWSWILISAVLVLNGCVGAEVDDVGRQNEAASNNSSEIEEQRDSERTSTVPELYGPVATDQLPNNPIPTDGPFPGKFPGAETPDGACQIFTIPNVNFESGSSELTLASQESIRLVLVDLQQIEGQWSLLVVGHADSRDFSGTGGNMELSERRAQAVLELLVESGLDVESRPVGRGSEEPIEDGNSPQALAKNRRVELVIECGT